MRRSRLLPLLVLCLATLAVAGLDAQSASSAGAASSGPDRPHVDDTIRTGSGAGYGALAGRPRVRAARTDTPPTIDGRLDDPMWRTAAMLSEFVQQAPLDGAPATEQTEVYIAYDRDHLYFGFYLHYADPGIMRANRVDRDTAWQDDLMTVYLDTFLDQQRCYDFDLNAYNVQGDGVINAGQARGGPIPVADRSWDALFYSGAAIVEDGYTAEMAIPFKSIRYPRQPTGGEHRWGFQIVREIKGKDQENVVWAPMSRDVQSFMGQMGVLEGMTDLSTSRNLEILPSFTAIRFGELDRASGAFADRGTDPEAGINLKYGITSNLTADFTYNPDFSQIESDLPQIEVNQRFPIFFPELRPFFLEGAEIFDVPSPVTLVDTRTLVDPNLGGKLTGKVGNTTLGVLVADDEAHGRRDDRADPAFGRNAQVFIGRARYDLYSESHLGALVTNRQAPGEVGVPGRTPPDGFGDGFSRVAGLDGQFRIGRASRMNFVAYGSRHRGASPAAATASDPEPLRTGAMWGVLFQHRGRHLTTTSFVGQTSPGFRTDLGFVRRVDQQRTFHDVGYTWWPESWLINWGPSVRYERSYNYDGILEDEIVNPKLNFEFARNISAGVNATRALERFGGIDFRRTTVGLSANSSTNRLFSVGASVDWGDQILYDPAAPYLGRGSTGSIFATVRPTPRLTSQINVATSRFVDVRGGGETDVFNGRIVRALSTFTFTDRLLLRNITEYNSFRGTLGTNLLFTYRINALTVFYAGYDDHYRQAHLIEIAGDRFFPLTDYRRTNRAFFTKLRVLLRY